MPISTTEQDRVLTLTLANPEAGNSIDIATAASLLKFLQTLDQKQSNHQPAALVVRADCLMGKKERIWLSGGNLQEIARISTSEAKLYAQSMVEAGTILRNLPLPVITVLDGAAFGGGAEFALFGDIRIGSPEAKMEFRQLLVGLSSGFGGGEHLVRLLGLAKAQRYLFLSQPHTSEELLADGLLHVIAESPTAAHQRGIEAAKRLAAQSPEAFAAQKKILSSAIKDDISPAESLKLFSQAWHNPKHKEYLQGFINRQNQP